MPFLGVAGIGGLVAFLKRGTPPTVSGGILSEDSTYFYRTFKGSSTLTVTGGVLNADVLVVAGGGGGGLRGSRGSGGGGAGGLLAFTAQALTPTDYSVVVGAGGAGATVGNGYGALAASRGGDSRFGSLTLVYGGGGGETNSLTTGSQGGSSNDYGASTNWTPTQGNAGGTAVTPNWGGGGGGGKGAAGANAASNNSGGNGGVGVNTYSTWATATGTGSGGYYAGGGGGGSYSTSGTPGTGGLGGGANGSTGAPGNAATIHTGGGGGGIYTTVDTSAGAGGSGVVIVRYPKNSVATSTNSYELIGTINLASPQSLVTFSSIPSSQYKHLQIRMVTRSSTTYGDDVILRFNGDSGSNYSHHLLVGNGSNATAYAGTTQTYIKGGYTIASDATPSQSFGASIVDIFDFASTTKNKTTRNLTGGSASGGSNSQIQLWSGAWYSTSAVTSITLSSIAGANFLTGSRFSLYGIRG